MSKVSSQTLGRRSRQIQRIFQYKVEGNSKAELLPISFGIIWLVLLELSCGYFYVFEPLQSLYIRNVDNQDESGVMINERYLRITCIETYL